jgi:hypothetical protein
MVYFQTKNPTLGKFKMVLQWKMLAFLWPFCLLYGQNDTFLQIIYYILVHFVVIWYISPRFWYVVARKIWQPWLKHVRL